MSRDPGDEHDDGLPPLVRAFVLANLPAITAMARVAEHGGKKHGGGMGPGSGQTVGDHLDHANAHLLRAMAFDGALDPETGELDIAHAATRLVMAGGAMGAR